MARASSIYNVDEYTQFTVSPNTRFITDGGWVQAGYTLNCTDVVAVYPTFDKVRRTMQACVDVHASVHQSQCV